MRHITLIFTIFVIIVCLITPCRAAAAEEFLSWRICDIDSNNPERLKSMILMLITPEIQKAVDEYYAPYLTISPSYWACYGSEIVSIQGDVCDSLYIVRIEILPYIGPHVSVGKDSVTAEINGVGEVSVTDYEHLENHELTWNLQGIIKQLPPTVD